MTDSRPRMRRARPRTVRALATAVVGALLFTLAPLPAAADTDAVDVDEIITQVSIEVGSNGAAASGTPITATATTSNGTDDRLAEGTVRLELNRTPLADAAALSAWLDTGAAPGPFDVLDSQETPEIAPLDRTQTALMGTVEETDDLAEGVYAVRAVMQTGEADVTERTELTARAVLTIRDAAPQVGVLVPVTATPESGELLTSDELSALTGPEGSLTAVLDAVAGTEAVLAIDPAIVASIRVLGASAPIAAIDWLTRLETMPNERFALQFGDADATAQAVAGLPELLQPTSLTVFTNPDDFAVDATPAPTTAPTAPELPDEEQLRVINRGIEGVLWPEGQVDAAVLETFTEYLGDEGVTILPASAVEGETGAHATAGGADLLVLDDVVSQTLSAAAAELDAERRAALLARAAAELFFSGAPASGVLIGLQRDQTRTMIALDEVLDSVSTTPLRSIRTAEPVDVDVIGAPDQTRASAISTLMDDEQRLEAFATILADPQVLLGPERVRLLRLLAVQSDNFENRLSAHRVSTVKTLNSVDIQDPRPIQLLTANVDLPVWVRNDLPWPVNLRLYVQPSDSRIDIERVTEVTALGASNTRVNLPVASRIASGELDVRFSLTSPSGVTIGTAKTADVTVRAEWEGIGLGILATVIVLLLGFGVIRTVRRRRRDEDAGSEADAGAVADAGAETEPAPDGGADAPVSDDGATR